jgi:undecaprenyl-diphosphatase
MDFPDIVNAVILGILEGLTEFLPVSSTGHLIITADVLGFDGESAKTFEIFIQLGAILAILWHYRAKVLHVAGNMFSEPAAARFVTNLIIAFIPAAVLGVLFRGFIKAYLFNPVTVAAALVVGGIVILVVEHFARTPRIQSVDDMTWRDALKVGFAQSAALFPGVSRSGATIMGGMVFGLSRTAATEFSFFLAIPTMFAATFYDLYKSMDLLQAQDIPQFAAGFLCAFVAALLVVRGFLKYVGKHTFRPFAYYRIVFGLIVLWYFV